MTKVGGQVDRSRHWKCGVAVGLPFICLEWYNTTGGYDFASGMKIRTN